MAGSSVKIQAGWAMENFFRAPEGVPKYTKKAKCARGVVKSHVHRVPPYPMYMAIHHHPHGTFCLFSVLWYTFRGSKKVFAMAQTV